MVTLEPVPTGGTKLKGVTAFCINENPVTGTHLCGNGGGFGTQPGHPDLYGHGGQSADVKGSDHTRAALCPEPGRIQYLSSLSTQL